MHVGVREAWLIFFWGVVDLGHENPCVGAAPGASAARDLHHAVWIYLCYDWSRRSSLLCHLCVDDEF